MNNFEGLIGSHTKRSERWELMIKSILKRKITENAGGFYRILPCKSAIVTQLIGIYRFI